MKKITLLISAVFILVLLLISPVLINAQAQFKVSDLSISPPYIAADAANGNVNISVKVANTGTEAGTYKLELKINDQPEVTKDITLESGKEQTVVIPVTRQDPGEYSVAVGELNGVFNVGPKGLEIKNLIIDPTEAIPNQKIVISTTVQNTLSDEPIKYDSLKLFINGKVENQESISLDANESKTISYTVNETDTGNYMVQVGPKTGSFTVKASFFSSLDWWMWAAIGIIVIAIIVMGALIIILPKKKKAKTAKAPPGRATRMPPQATPVQPVPVQPMQGQRMPPPRFPQQQTPPYPGYQAQTPGPQPQVPGAQPPHGQVPPRAVPPYPETQQPGQPPAPQQQMPAFSGQTQQPPQKPATPYPRQSQPPPGAMPPYPGQQTPPRPFAPQQMPPQPGQMHQPPRPDSQQPSAVPVFTPPGQMGFPPKNPGAPPRVAPQFTVSNLMISPQQVKDGDAVSISAVVTNNTTMALPYSMVLRIGGVVEEIAELTLNPGISQTGLFNVIREEPGDYYVEVDGQRGIFTVIRRLPAAFNVSNLSITPDKVKQGDPIAISTVVSNTGETSGSYSVVLRIKGIAENIEEVELEPGRSQKVTFNIIKDAAGFYPVAIENLTGRFVVEMDWKG